MRCAQGSAETKQRIRATTEQRYGGVGFAGSQQLSFHELPPDVAAARVQAMRDGLMEYMSQPANVQQMNAARTATMLARYGVPHTMSEGSPFRRRMIDGRNATDWKSASRATRSAWSPERREEFAESQRAASRAAWDRADSEERARRARASSRSRRRYLDREQPAARERRRERSRLAARAFWDGLSSEERTAELARRSLSTSKSSRKRVSKTNRRWADRLAKVSGLQPEFEPSVGPWNLDIAIGGVRVDINPTVSHNSDVSFSHIVGICREELCARHRPTGPQYHQQRASAIEAAGLDWVFVFDHDDPYEIQDLVREKTGTPGRKGRLPRGPRCAPRGRGRLPSERPADGRRGRLRDRCAHAKRRDGRRDDLESRRRDVVAARRLVAGARGGHGRRLPRALERVRPVVRTRQRCSRLGTTPRAYPGHWSNSASREETCANRAPCTRTSVRAPSNWPAP